MIFTGEVARIVQLHPTRHCNLACAHCYSSSGPREREQLPPEVVDALVEDAATEGYNVLSLSGGEPLMYPHLERVLRAARAAGLVANVVTNGTLLDDERVALLAELAGTVAVSLDGKPEDHDRMRGRPGAFAALEAGVARLAAAGFRFGVVFTLSERNCSSLLWAARFAAACGAASLHVHALDDVGRGAALGDEVPLDETRSAVWLAVGYLRRTFPELAIQLDLADRHVAARALEPPTADDGRLATLLSPLVVEPDGTVAPLQYGFPRRFALGSLHDARLGELARRWRSTYPVLRSACCGPLRVLRDSDDVIDLYRSLAERV
ncbi:MAG: radical SAM protein [Deltaproteobacteria bacterium]|nr:radical SAM protein [Deltaproteobacteria bacterium]